MSLEDLLDRARDAIIKAYRLSNAGAHSETVQLLEPIISELRTRNCSQPDIFMVTVSLAQAFEHSSNAQFKIGKIEDAMAGWRKAIHLYSSALLLSLEEINEQSANFGLAHYSLRDQHGLFRVKVQFNVGIAGSAYRLANALKEKWQNDEAKQFWERAKLIYTGFVSDSSTPSEVKTQSAIVLADMCIADQELDKARAFYSFAKEQPTVTPVDMLSIQAGLQRIDQFRAR